CGGCEACRAGFCLIRRVALASRHRAFAGIPSPPSKRGAGNANIGAIDLAIRVATEDPMSRHAGNVTRGALAGAACLAASLGFSVLALGAPPDFAPDPSIGWYAYNRLFIPPASGAGPLLQD